MQKYTFQVNCFKKVLLYSNESIITTVWPVVIHTCDYQWFLTFLENYPFWCIWKPNYPQNCRKICPKNLSKDISKKLSKICPKICQKNLSKNLSKICSKTLSVKFVQKICQKIFQNICHKIFLQICPKNLSKKSKNWPHGLWMTPYSFSKPSGQKLMLDNRI